MATVLDVSAVITSALTEIGVTGEVDVTMDGTRRVTWLGEPSGDDVQVAVAVTMLPLAQVDRAAGRG